MSDLIATQIWQVDMRNKSGQWEEFLFACSTISEAKNMAFSLHPDWPIGAIESFVTRDVWVSR